MTVFTAMLIDAYRELNSKKLFWIILGISGLVVLNFASIGFHDDGMSLFFGLIDFENPLLARGSFMAGLLYRSIFSSFIVGIWLAWIATILALISTTTIFPDFISGGAIDLVLSKPIGRIRLFLIKFVTSLLFVLLQVGVFCVGVFFCMGLRLGEWEWKIFAAIPLVVLFYSYLYSVNVLVGVWTRSALTALLVTLLMWVSVFGINTADFIFRQNLMDMIVQIEESDEQIERLETSLAGMEERKQDDAMALVRARFEGQLESARTKRDEQHEAIDELDRWHPPIRIMRAILPKTSDTIALLDRWLKRDTDVNIMDLLAGNVEQDSEGRFRTTDQSRVREVRRRMQSEDEAQPVWLIIGTSMLFQAVVLALAGWLFVRRDY